MSDFRQRLKDELSELSEKTNKLESFTDTKEFDKLSQIQKSLLIVQLNAMHTYCSCLYERSNNL